MPDLLTVEALSAGWGNASVLSGISFSLAEGQSLALLGRNGMGKTTLLCALLGIARHGSGTIRLAGREITRLRPETRAQAGIGWVPQERNIFRSLTVEENLTAVARPGPWSPAEIFAMFPRLAERRRNMGNQLSGGEQQMLAIARALMARPKLLLLDEPSLGLAPLIVAKIFEIIRAINQQGTTILLVEQNANMALRVANRGYVLETGRIVLQDDAQNLMNNEEVKKCYLGVRHDEIDLMPAPLAPM